MARYYTFRQNNSGGSFTEDAQAGIGPSVCIEALDAGHANQRAESLGIYFNGCDDGMDCECCGDRWYPVSEHDADDVPSLYGQPLAADSWGPAFIHRLDGSIEAIGGAA